MFSHVTFILGWFWYFSVAFVVVTTSVYEEIFFRLSIPRFWTIFPKYLLKIPTNLLLSETTLLFSTKVILWSFKVLSVNEGFMVFRKVYFWWCVSRWGCILRWGYCKTPFWSFLIVWHNDLSVFYMQMQLLMSFPFYLYLTTWNDSWLLFASFCS